MPPPSSSPSPSPSGGVNDRILTYGDATVLRSDLTILAGPHFLNDRLLHFYFSHLSDDHRSILLVPPSLSFLISNFPDPTSLSEVLCPLHLTEKELILFPVNNNDDVNLAEGGSHWSLLVCYVKEMKFVHHDSSGGMNRVYAVKLFRAVKEFVGGFEWRGKNNLIQKLFRAVKEFFGGFDWRYLEGPTPQQMNGYDCGLFVLAIARFVCKWYCNNKNKNNIEELWFDELMEEVNGNKVRELRAELRDLVLELVEEKNNS